MMPNAQGRTKAVRPYVCARTQSGKWSTVAAVSGRTSEQTTAIWLVSQPVERAGERAGEGGKAGRKAMGKMCWAGRESVNI